MADIYFPYVYQDSDALQGLKVNCIDANFAEFSPLQPTLISTSVIKKAVVNSVYNQGSSEVYSLLQFPGASSGDYLFPLVPLPRGLNYYYMKYNDLSSLELIEFDSSKLYDVAYGFQILIMGSVGAFTFSFNLYDLQPQ